MARNSKIILSKNIKMDKNYKSVLNYNEEQMISLMSESANILYSDFNYNFIRERGTIQVNANYSQCIQANYMAFQNPDYSNKWFFAFIDDVIFLSPKSTEIVYTIDIWTTWFSYWSAKACLVLREHVIDDTIGANTVPESLELGEYIINDHVRDTTMNTLKLVLVSTVLPYQPELNSVGGIYNGVYSGFSYYTYSADDMSDAIQNIVDLVGTEPIVSLFLAPSFLVPTSELNPHNITESEAPSSYTIKISPITSLDSYMPVNKKLLTYPFCYILGSNSCGGNAIYHQELFKGTDLLTGKYMFTVYGVLTPGCSIDVRPVHYKRLNEVNCDDGFNLGKFPQCSWAADMYTNWITQNGVNVATNIMNNSLNVLTSLATGNASGVQSGVTGLINAQDQIRRADLIPPQAGGNVNSGDIVTATQENTFHFYSMSIKSEFARRIDQYFTRVGYRVNEVKIPNMANRTNYNYVQVAQEENVAYPNNYNNICLPAKALDQINSLFRSGVTIWNNHANFGDYSVTNVNTYTPPTP